MSGYSDPVEGQLLTLTLWISPKGVTLGGVICTLSRLVNFTKYLINFSIMFRGHNLCAAFGRTDRIGGSIVRPSRLDGTAPESSRAHLPV